MSVLPVLVTPRLTLRPCRFADAGDVQRLAGDVAVADTTLQMPHPYEDGMAEAWIATHETNFERGDSLVLAVALTSPEPETPPAPRTLAAWLPFRVDREPSADRTPLIGAISLRFTPLHARAELGYWVGQPYWGQGYATEAARAMVAYGFEQAELNRIFAQHFLRNPASGRVLQKVGLRYEGRLRQHVRRWERFEDVEVYGLLRDEWLAGKHSPLPGSESEQG